MGEFQTAEKILAYGLGGGGGEVLRLVFPLTAFLVLLHFHSACYYNFTETRKTFSALLPRYKLLLIIAHIANEKIPNFVP